MLTLTRRRVALTVVVVGVLLSHALLTRGVMRHLLHSADDSPTIERMEAQLVADMKLTAPPVVAALPVPTELPSLLAETPAAPPTAASAASKPKPKPTPALPASAASKAEAAPAAASTPTQVADATSAPIMASAPSAPEAVASAPTFEWPKATRVTFKMEGYLRGPIYGSALVEWIRQDTKYQVHVDAYAGPSFAPMASQRWTSEGTITPKGLVPARFESINKLLIKSSAPKIVAFEDKALVMPDGERIDKLPDVQDPASHYIQMAYQLMLDSRNLAVGQTIEMPMVNTKKQQRMVYDIEASELLDTPLGQIDTFRLKPRLPTKNSKGEDVLAEIWIAPALQYLPIRMLIRIGNETFFDMKMDKAPQQTAADAAVKFPELR